MVKIHSIVSEEKFFEGRVYGCTDGRKDGLTDGHNAITTARWPLASGANKSTVCGCQRSAVGCLKEDKKSKSQKGHNSLDAFRIVSLNSMDCSLDSKQVNISMIIDILQNVKDFAHQRRRRQH